ncbi:hypothetical protein C943_02802 [Mariniradius saccharolyticus AK6]|uniref:Uncharacterized protein n=1 Tax=Mariniradius saccharolyticus AK6 TaxID=1239962 RepID=M7X094_9BACT|nr:hypothetical protein C943_02802 [Mariniradius saccharolyticus AK6]
MTKSSLMVLSVMLGAGIVSWVVLLLNSVQVLVTQAEAKTLDIPGAPGSPAGPAGPV